MAAEMNKMKREYEEIKQLNANLTKKQRVDDNKREMAELLLDSDDQIILDAEKSLTENSAEGGSSTIGEEK